MKIFIAVLVALLFVASESQAARVVVRARGRANVAVRVNSGASVIAVRSFHSPVFFVGTPFFASPFVNYGFSPFYASPFFYAPSPAVFVPPAVEVVTPGVFVGY